MLSASSTGGVKTVIIQQQQQQRQQQQHQRQHQAQKKIAGACVGSVYNSKNGVSARNIGYKKRKISYDLKTSISNGCNQNGWSAMHHDDNVNEIMKPIELMRQKTEQVMIHQIHHSEMTSIYNILSCTIQYTY